MTFAQAQEATGWKQVTSRDGLYPGVDRAAFWVRVAVKSSAVVPAGWVFTLDSRRWDEIDWYVIRQNGAVESHAAGNSRSGPPGMLSGLLPNIVVLLEPGEEAVLYLRCQTLARGALPLVATGLAAPRPQAGALGVYTFSFGALGVLCLLGVLFTMYGKQPGGLTYALCTLSVALFYAGLSGYAKMEGWPGAHFLAMRGGNFLVELTVFAALLYLRSFFEVGYSQRRWPDRVWWCLMVASLVGLPLSLVVPFFPFAYYAIVHSAVYAVACLAIAVWAWRQGMVFARFYVLSWSLMWFFILMGTSGNVVFGRRRFSAGEIGL